MKIGILLLFLLFTLIVRGQIVVADLTFKLEGKSEKLLHYAFYKGDEIIISLEETEGKDINEVNFGPYTSTPLYQNYKVNKISDKSIKIDATQVYEFKIANTEGRSKYCKLNITRIAPEHSKSFTTQVQWREVADTIFDIKKETVTSGYRTVEKQKSKKVLASVDTSTLMIINRTERVNSNLSGSSTSILTFEIPDKIAEPSIFNPMKETSVVSWSYLISAEGDIKHIHEAANSKLGKELIATVSVSMGIPPELVSMFKFTMNGMSLFSTPPKGNNVMYSLAQAFQGQWVPIKNGNSIISLERFTDIRPGQYALKLINDNALNGINVSVQVMAIRVTKNYELEHYTVQDQEPVKETREVKVPKKINITKKPEIGVIRP